MSDAIPGARHTVDGGALHSRLPPREWIVLIVDDEPEIHAVTRMLLSRVRFNGAPITLHSAYSAAQARAFLERQRDVALILLDVVMESDDAGLRLCRYVRDVLRNEEVQIVVRTGQPGRAPESEVILGYGINGYVLKTDLTSQKLHSLVVASLRTYDYMRSARRASRDLDAARARPAYRVREGAGEALLAAIRDDQLSLLAQPQVDIHSGVIAGVELVVRWCSREHGEVELDGLQEVAAYAGIVGPLTDWILRRACELGKAARECRARGLRVSVDVGQAQLQGGVLLAAVRHWLQLADMPAGTLEFEIPECLLASERQVDDAVLQSIQGLGAGVVIDRCGIGVASLARLRQLQPARLKIDASLVRTLNSNPDSAAIARTLIALAHTLQMSVVAEGVETQAQLEFLEWEACEEAQGPFLCSPMTTDHVLALLRGGGTRVQYPAGGSLTPRGHARGPHWGEGQRLNWVARVAPGG